MPIDGEIALEFMKRRLKSESEVITLDKVTDEALAGLAIYEDSKYDFQDGSAPESLNSSQKYTCHVWYKVVEAPTIVKTLKEKIVVEGTEINMFEYIKKKNTAPSCLILRPGQSEIEYVEEYCSISNFRAGVTYVEKEYCSVLTKDTKVIPLYRREFK